MAKSKKNKGNPGLLLLGLAGLAIVGGLSYYVANQPKPEASPSKEPQSRVERPAPIQQPGEPVTVFTPEYSQGELKFKETRQAAEPGQSKEAYAINAFLKQTGFVPANAKVLSVSVQNGLATVTFSEAFETTYGTEDEQTLVNGILKTLGQFKEIRKVVFKVGSHSLDTLGSIDLTEPQDVIR